MLRDDPKQDVSNLWTFTEDSDSTVEGVMQFGAAHIPTGLAKTKLYGLQNCIIGALRGWSRKDRSPARRLTKLETFCSGPVRTYALSNGALPVFAGCAGWFLGHIYSAEIDLADKSVDWDGEFTMESMIELLVFLLHWMKDNLGPRAKAMVNIRDFPIAMIACKERVHALVSA
eukprot:SAG22_NODE_1150_length_5351_cov_3.848439_1_plen_173_part_00